MNDLYVFTCRWFARRGEVIMVYVSILYDFYSWYYILNV